MQFPDRLIPRSITTQITSIVAVSVMLGVVLTVTMLLFFGIRDGPSAVAGRIANITRLVRSAASPTEVGVIIAATQRSGIDVRYVALADLEASPPNAKLPVLSGLIAHQLESSQNIEVIADSRYPAGPAYQLVVKMDDRAALIFAASPGTSAYSFLLAPTTLTLTTVLVFVLFLSIYAVRWIIAPLSAVVAAAQSFGRSPDSNHAVNRPAPREIAQVADALNEMQIRIRNLLDDRTRMLAAISHDLRTPLTRLRLRAERIADQSLRESMLREIEQISYMLNETLDYLRHDARSEVMSRVDLPSLLQTVCADFADVGHNVSYEGPGRLTWTCRPATLTRAISNIVANGVKHGSFVTVNLRTCDDGTAEIDISDDGPGIPAALRTKVFEPFFKGDDARALAGDGFGLGLSIARDAVSGHRGEISLLQRLPTGLIVRIQIPRADENEPARERSVLNAQSDCPQRGAA
ncbi:MULTISPECIES: ATP-binding protein [unclassified Bradyrhizobium]|uniref:ATP-binding protein n=1 Tax=unclassified Bradyrhizobium TaxID=2631580 RepID=UPI002FEFDF98